MTRWLWVMAVGALAGCAPTVRAGGPPVVLAVLDRVVLEPNETNPTHVQLWGTFALAQGKGKYHGPVSGCLYYQPQESDGKEPFKEWTLKEWAQLRKLAGKREVVAFGFCHTPEQAGKVRRDISKNDLPDTYPLGSVEVVTRAEDWQAIDPEAIMGLLKVTSPRTPAREGKAPPGLAADTCHLRRNDGADRVRNRCRNSRVSWSFPDCAWRRVPRPTGAWSHRRRPPDVSRRPGSTRSAAPGSGGGRGRRGRRGSGRSWPCGS